ncbi:MAG: hypothetical protein GXY52_06050 [Chloroflexi bacterium]|nr:hypothetical protein [Chloroflexota bacterium]
MQVTHLESQRGQRRSMRVILDDGSELVLTEIVAAGLHVGQELDAADLEQLRQRDMVERAYERALFYLSFRPRSQAEITRYLADKQLGAASEAVIERLKRYGLVDDDDFARRWVEHRSGSKPFGRWAIGAELRRAGVDAEVTKRALAEIDEEDNAKRAGEHKARQLANLEQYEFRAKLNAFLQRRGFGFDVINTVVSELWAQISARQNEELHGNNGQDPYYINRKDEQ